LKVRRLTTDFLNFPNSIFNLTNSFFISLIRIRHLGEKNMAKISPELKKGVISWAIKGVLYKAYAAAVLMPSEGRWNWLDSRPVVGGIYDR